MVAIAAMVGLISVLIPSPDFLWKGRHLGCRKEQGNDRFVPGHYEAEEGGRRQTGLDGRQHDPEKDSRWRSSQRGRCVFQGFIHSAQCWRPV